MGPTYITYNHLKLQGEDRVQFLRNISMVTKTNKNFSFVSGENKSHAGGRKNNHLKCVTGSQCDASWLKHQMKKYFLASGRVTSQKI